MEGPPDGRPRPGRAAEEFRGLGMASSGRIQTTSSLPQHPRESPRSRTPESWDAASYRGTAPRPAIASTDARPPGRFVSGPRWHALLHISIAMAARTLRVHSFTGRAG